MAVPRDVQAYEMWRAVDANRIKNQAFRGLRGANGIRTIHTSRDTIIAGPPRLRIGLFQLTEPFTLPDPGEYTQGDGDTAYSDNAYPVWYDARTDIQEYDRSTDSYTVKRLYAPCSFLGVSGETIGHPPATTNQRVWAVWNRQSGHWEILNTPVDIWRFQLTEALTAGSNATANLLPWTGAAYAEDSDVQFEVYDAFNQFALADDAQGYAKWMPDSGRWEVIPQSSVTTRKFELKDTLTPGGQATAYLRYWSGAAWTTDTGTEFEVYDALGVYRGRAKGASTGSYGEATYNTESSRWEITWLQPHAIRITCLVDMTGGLETTDANITVDSVAIMNPTGAILLASVTTVANTFSWEADDDAIVHAEWDEASQTFKAAQVECPA